MKRSSLAPIVALAVLAFAGTSCKKEGSGVSGESATILNYLPKDSATLIGFSWAKLRSSAFFKKIEDKALGEARSTIAQVKETCGIDLVNDINTMVLALGEDPDDQSKIFAAVKGNFDKAKIDSCTEKLGIQKDGAIEAEGGKLYTYWPANDMVIVSTVNDSEAIKKAIEGGNVSQNDALMKMVNKVDSSATIWGAALIPAEAAGMLGGMASPKSGYGSLSVDSGMSANIGVVFGNEEEAKNASMMLSMGLSTAKQQAAPFKDILDAVSSEQSGDTIVVKVKLSAEQIESLSKMGASMPF